MIISKLVGKQYGQRPAVPVTCKGCGRPLQTSAKAKHEICGRCVKDRKLK